VDALFGGAAVSREDEAAAKTLSGAFAAVPTQVRRDAAGAGVARGEGSGRPTRAAATELSLDHVFREPTQRTSGGRPRSEFSFDQFFSGGDAAPEDSEPAPPPASQGASPDDITQFNSWLEGLKKK
jgi:hypothetical protein